MRFFFDRRAKGRPQQQGLSSGIRLIAGRLSIPGRQTTVHDHSCDIIGRAFHQRLLDKLGAAAFRFATLKYAAHRTNIEHPRNPVAAEEISIPVSNIAAHHIGQQGIFRAYGTRDRLRAGIGRGFLVRSGLGSERCEPG